MPITAFFDGTVKEEKCVSQQTKAKTFNSLYATPKEIPLADSPYSSPPSPYIVNHKARRPALLLKNSSDELDVDVEATTTTTFSLRKSTSLSIPISEADDTNGVHERPVWDSTPPQPQGTFWDDNCLAWESNLLESVRIKETNKDHHEPEYFYNRGQSVSFTSNSDVEDDDAGAENSHNLYSSDGGEFYDARDGN